MADEIRYLTFKALECEEIVHAIFMRYGGVSPEPWNSLNFGGTVGDEAKNVLENRRRAFHCLNLDHHAVFDVWQVHGKNVAIANAPRHPDTPHERADIIVTDQAGVVLLMRFADCVPILLYDPTHHAIGIAHAGWKGTVLGVTVTAVEAMKSRYHSEGRDLIAAIGPSIGPDHYRVGSDVVEQVAVAFGSDASRVLISREDGRYLDLWQANMMQLESVGVKTIHTSRVCTACHLDDWYSHRGQHGKTGRFGAVIALKDGQG